MTNLKKITINGHDFLVGAPDTDDQVIVFARKEEHLSPAFDRIGHVEHVGGEFPYKIRIHKERLQAGIEKEGKWTPDY